MLKHQYEPLETLAPALFGSVQKWRFRPTGECVAVKRMELRFAARKRSKSTERAVDEDLFTEIKTNLRVQALGGHPHVLPLRDCIMEDEAVLLVLKFCARGELLDALNAGRAAGLQLDVLRYFAEVANGARFLHAHDIAHRDLSLENVLLDDYDHCHITDFGLAAQCSGKMAVRPVGKTRYMAPEVCAAFAYEDNQTSEYDPKAADVWALGVMLYAMVAGRYPFREPLRRDDRFRLLEDFGVDYLLEKDDVDVCGKEDVVDLLRMLLIVDPARRPTLAEVVTHRALPEVDNEPTSPTVLQTVGQETRASMSSVAATRREGNRQRTRSLNRFGGRGSLASVSPSAPQSEAEKNKQALASSAVKATAIAPAPGVSSSAKSPCSTGRLLKKCFASARA